MQRRKCGFVVLQQDCFGNLEPESVGRQAGIGQGTGNQQREALILELHSERLTATAQLRISASAENIDDSDNG